MRECRDNPVSVQHSDLRNIEHAKFFTLYIVIDVNEVRVAVKFLEALGPLAYDLKDKGITLRLNCPGGVGPGTPNLASSYDMPRAEWLEKTRK